MIPGFVGYFLCLLGLHDWATAKEVDARESLLGAVHGSEWHYLRVSVCLRPGCGAVDDEIAREEALRKEIEGRERASRERRRRAGEKYAAMKTERRG